MARVACETFATTGMVVIGGEIGLKDKGRLTSTMGRIPEIARGVIRDIGYEQEKFHWNTCHVLNFLHEQSAHIAQGVDNDGAGDQGIMFGYATNETPEYMPLPITLAHKLVRRLAEFRKNGTLPFLRPDGKAQVTVEYDGDKPVRVDTIVLSAQHTPNIKVENLRQEVTQEVILPIVPPELIDARTRIYINPTGRFVIGGPMGDAGLTGRKIIVDTYGGMARHGGGAFSGKDPTKVDRSASYAARYVAKNIVAAGLAEKCEIQLAYAIGVARPVSIMVDTFGTGKVDEGKLAETIQQLFDLRPAGIIKELNLRRPIYKQIAAYGHFGRMDLDLPWERLDKVEELQSCF